MSRITHLVRIQGSYNGGDITGRDILVSCLLNAFYLHYSGLMNNHNRGKLGDLLLLEPDSSADWERVSDHLSSLSREVISRLDGEPYPLSVPISDDELYIYNRMAQGTEYENWKRNLSLNELLIQREYLGMPYGNCRIESGSFSWLPRAPVSLTVHEEIYRDTWLGTPEIKERFRELYGHLFKYPTIHSEYNNHTIVDCWLQHDWQLEALQAQFDKISYITAEKWQNGKCIDIKQY